MKTDKELADELDARDRLINQGYQWVKCASCNGLATKYPPEICSCSACSGKGGRWQAPMMRKNSVISDAKMIEAICRNQPKVSAERMRESILRQNGKNPATQHGDEEK